MSGARLQLLRERIGSLDGDEAVDALLVTCRSNIRYLTGFSGSAGVLLVGPARAVLFTDGRYRLQAADEIAAAGVDVPVEVGGAAAQREALAREARGLGRLGLEAPDVTWARQRSMAELLEGVELVPTTGLVEALRAVKDEAELKVMEDAAAIADGAFPVAQEMVASVLAGAEVTEAAVALALDAEMRRLGASGSSFQTIVASGPNGAKPHARPSERRIGRGELVVCDYGAILDGYCSDMTRTICAGEPRSALLAAAVEVVAASQAAGVAAVAPGVVASAVDQACRSVIKGAGWAEAFSHGTGHGVGLDVHEAPAVGPASTDVLSEGSVVTVEPGVYMPDHGGVRIEDTVVVCASGCRAITRAPKDLVV